MQMMKYSQDMRWHALWVRPHEYHQCTQNWKISSHFPRKTKKKHTKKSFPNKQSSPFMPSSITTSIITNMSLLVYVCIIWREWFNRTFCVHTASVPHSFLHTYTHRNNKKKTEKISFPFISTFCKYLNKSENNIETIWRTFKRIKYIKYWMGRQWMEMRTAHNTSELHSMSANFFNK